MTVGGAASEVEVPAYRGPLDLLLHLVKEEEVDIYDIPVSRILKRYLEELARLEAVDINAAGEFLLMAVTLMELKSRQMLPPEERGELDLEEDDPRADLVRQLLEYRRFRQAADEFGRFADRRALAFGRAGFAQGLDLGEAGPADPSEELREVEVFDLLHAYEGLMRAILADTPRTIVYDDISVEERIEELVLALRESEQLRFSEFARRAADRADAAAIFGAILEATRRKLVAVYQPEPLGELYVSARGDQPDADFAPPQGEAAGAEGKKPVPRHGVFTGFVDPEEEDLDLAFDHEGRRAVTRLEEAVRGAEEAIRRFAPRPGREPAPAGEPAAAQGPAVRQWTDEFDPPPQEGGAAAGEPPAPEPEKPAEPVVRQWTDSERSEAAESPGEAAEDTPPPPEDPPSPPPAEEAREEESPRAQEPGPESPS